MRVSTFSAVFMLLLLVLANVITCSSHSLGDGEVDTRLSLIDKITSGKKELREESENTILENRKKLINDLIPIIDVKNAEKYDEKARASAAWLLGKLRAVEAVPVLAAALEKEPFDHPGEKQGIHHYHACVFTALVKIGLPSIPSMIENLGTNSNRKVISDSLIVMSRSLGGKRRVFELLDGLVKKETDPEKKKKLEDVRKYAATYLR